MKSFSAFACFNLALAIALGALGAHYLKEMLEPQRLASFEVGVRYHIYFSVIILVLSRSIERTGTRPLIAMAVGMLFFSLSIYLLSTRGILLPAGSATWLGPITPIGGLLGIGSLLWCGVQFIKSESSRLST